MVAEIWDLKRTAVNFEKNIFWGCVQLSGAFCRQCTKQALVLAFFLLLPEKK
ncbi:MAG: hypothetical protein RLZZ28_2507 [Bacteroidota bacterium]